MKTTLSDTDAVKSGMRININGKNYTITKVDKDNVTCTVKKIGFFANLWSKISFNCPDCLAVIKYCKSIRLQRKSHG